MRDIQNEDTPFPARTGPSAGVAGIKGVMTVKAGDCVLTRGTASFTALCPLSVTQRGLNMSRTGQAIYDYIKETQDDGIDTLETLALRLAKLHDARGATVAAEFDIPIEVRAPVTHTAGTKCIHCVMRSVVTDGEKEKVQNFLTVSTTEMSLCPCSKEMCLIQNTLTPEEQSAFDALPSSLKDKLQNAGWGAHNQTVDIEATVSLQPPAASPLPAPLAVSPLALYEILSSCASAATYPVMKREDEKHTTQCAWNTPRFVEDIARLAALKLDALIPQGISHYSVKVKSRESIHSDGIMAVAMIDSPASL